MINNEVYEKWPVQLPASNLFRMPQLNLCGRRTLAGGFGLTLLTLGAILMSTAFFLNKRDLVTYTVLTTGVVLILFTILYVYFKELRRLVSAHASIKSNKELIDAAAHCG